MALRFLDGFDHYATGSMGADNGSHDFFKRWSDLTHFGGGTGCQGSIVTGRFGNGFQGSASNCEFWLNKSIDYQSTWTVGFAVRWAGLSSPSGLFRLNDGGTTQVSLYPGTDGSLSLYRGDGSTWLAWAPPGTLAANVWFYIEIKTVVGNAGSCEVRINNVTVINYSGDTQASANAQASSFDLGGDRTQTGTTVFDDVYACDGTGGSPYDSFLGDIRVQAIYPNGNGTTSNFTGSDGNSVDNYLLVDEGSGGHDGDTTYAESGVVNDKDTYAYGDLSAASGTVYAVQPILEARKTDAGSRSVKSVARLSGGTEADGPSVSLGNSYNLHADIRTTKPGGGAWSVSDVNGAEFGMKVTA